MWHGSKQCCSSLCHSTEADKREHVQLHLNARPADRHIVSHRATLLSLLTKQVASMPNQHEELDMHDGNFSLLNRTQKTNFVPSLLLIAGTGMTGLAFLLPIFTTLVREFFK